MAAPPAASSRFPRFYQTFRITTRFARTALCLAFARKFPSLYARISRIPILSVGFFAFFSLAHSTRSARVCLTGDKQLPVSLELFNYRCSLMNHVGLNDLLNTVNIVGSTLMCRGSRSHCNHMEPRTTVLTPRFSTPFSSWHATFLVLHFVPSWSHYSLRERCIRLPSR